jgi:acyl-CoA thioester hydrolase
MAPRRDAPVGAFRYRHAIEIRFRDTDALGHVNNAVYLTYFEAARAGYYRAVTGSTFGTGEGAGAWTFIIASASVEYRSPALFGEPLLAECRIGWASRSSFSLEYLLTAEPSEVGAARNIADGETIQVMYDLEHRRATRIPAELIERFTAYEGRPIPPRPDA